MQNREAFYRRLKESYPKINQLPLWEEYDWSEFGYENSFIMTGLAREISNWDLESERGNLAGFFQIVEEAFTDSNNVTISILKTDFLVTIMEVNNKLFRDEVKKLMGKKTQHAYREMLQFYRES
ncbi:MAG: hypothetical protein ACOVRN_07275 [Flavobacterium sp.]